MWEKGTTKHLLECAGNRIYQLTTEKYQELIEKGDPRNNTNQEREREGRGREFIRQIHNFIRVK